MEPGPWRHGERKCFPDYRGGCAGTDTRKGMLSHGRPYRARRGGGGVVPGLRAGQSQVRLPGRPMGTCEDNVVRGQRLGGGTRAEAQPGGTSGPVSARKSQGSVDPFSWTPCSCLGNVLTSGQKGGSNIFASSLLKLMSLNTG